MNETNAMRATPTAQRASDRGFTLVEILIVIVVLGILATVTVFAMRGSTTSAEERTCRNDSKTLYTMVEAYFAQEGGRTIPPIGVTDDRYELTLVDAQIMRSVSANYDIDENGDLTADADGICD